MINNINDLLEQVDFDNIELVELAHTDEVSDATHRC